MDMTLVASEQLRDESDYLAEVLAAPDLAVVGDLGTYEQKGFGGVDWTLIVQLLGKGAVTGIGGLGAQVAVKQAWKQLSAALARVQRRAMDERRRANLAVEVPTHKGQFVFYLPADPEEVARSVEAIPYHLLAGEKPGSRSWVDGLWIES
jgi:hypothetical protein